MSIFVVIRLMLDAVIITQPPNFQGWLQVNREGRGSQYRYVFHRRCARQATILGHKFIATFLVSYC